MYEFSYNYTQGKYNKKAELYYFDMNSFIKRPRTADFHKKLIDT